MLKFYAGIKHLLTSVVATTLVIWSVALYDISRSRNEELVSAQKDLVFQAQAFAENARSTSSASTKSRSICVRTE